MKYDQQKIVDNYYKAINALVEIGVVENIPEELKELALEASQRTIKIIDYINNENKQNKEN